jgi:hypothetical protein
VIPSAETRLAKVRRLSRFGNAACIVLMIATSLGLCFVIWGAFTFPDATCDFGAGPLPCASLTIGARALTFGLLAAGAALFLKAMYHLMQLFNNYARGEIFTRESVTQIRRIGTTLFVLGAFQIAVLVATLALLSARQIAWPDHRPIPVPFVAFVAGGLIMLISWVMEIGTDLREENELTV